MSSRKEVEKVDYWCDEGHITRSRADKPAPKHCTLWSNGTGCTSKPRRQDSNVMVVTSETAHIGGLPIAKKKVVRKKK